MSFDIEGKNSKKKKKLQKPLFAALAEHDFWEGLLVRNKANFHNFEEIFLSNKQKWQKQGKNYKAQNAHLQGSPKSRSLWIWYYWTISLSFSFQALDGKVHFVYKKVAMVEQFFDIIYSVHVEAAGDTQIRGRAGKHCGQKRTYRAVSKKKYRYVQNYVLPRSQIDSETTILPLKMLAVFLSLFYTENTLGK